MTSILSIDRKGFPPPPEIAQVRTYGLDLEQRIRAAKLKREHSDPAGLQSGEERPEPVALERRTALAKLRFPRSVQNDERKALVPERGENGAGVLRQRPDRGFRCEREAASERIVADHRRERPLFRRDHNARAPEPDAVQSRLSARFASGVDGVLVQQHLRLVHERVKAHRVGPGWKRFIDRKAA